MPVDALDLTYAFGITVQRDVPLAPFTTLKMGGPADFFTRPRSARELARCLAAAHERGLPWLLLGGGSNMLIADRGVRGLVIKVEAEPAYRNRGEVLEERAGFVRARLDAGALSAAVARWTASLGWRGLEWACGVPGTIGGAAIGNAGAYDGDMAHVVERAHVWLPEGERTLELAELEYGYRTSRFKRDAAAGAILSVDVRLTRGDKDEALATIERNEEHRRAKQPSQRSCGSVFKNPPGDFSGRLIDLAGLKGKAVGDAQISEKHGNFFVNRGSARASDVVALIRLAQQRVLEVHGVRLEPEILLVGDWPAEEIAGL